VHSYTSYAINAIFFENYDNDGSDQEQERFFDNIVVSTSPIGCLDTVFKDGFESGNLTRWTFSVP
jgi:hypothetical protein